MKVWLGRFLQLSGMATTAGALMAGLIEPTLWNEMILLVIGLLVFGGGWLIEHRLRGIR